MPAVQDFEELLTFLKVEPVQWLPQRLRRVLNAAIASPISAQVWACSSVSEGQGQGCDVFAGVEEGCIASASTRLYLIRQ
jgi:hypothetical protein